MRNLILLLLGLFMFVSISVPAPLDDDFETHEDFDRLVEMQRQADSLEVFYYSNFRPIEQALHPSQRNRQIQRWVPDYAYDTLYVKRVVTEIFRNANELDLDPNLIAGVMLVEDPMLDSAVVSSAGAVGLMQVMPNYWLGVFDECGENLTSIRHNVCIGSRVLKHYLDTNGNEYDAFLAYNGCVRTPGCQRYYRWVDDNRRYVKSFRGD